MAPETRRARSRDAGEDVLAGRRPVLESLRAGGNHEKLLIARDLAPSQVIAEIRRRAEKAGIPIRFVPKAEIERAASGINHQGVVALTGRYRYAPLEDILSEPRAGVLFLDGVADPHNLGSLLRSADGAGLGGVVIPSHRATAVTAAVRRVSAGAAEVVPVARVVNLGRSLDNAKEAGLWVVGLDAKAKDDIWSAELLDPPVALVLGAEERGMSKGVRSRCDAIAAIPSDGRLSSLNVAVAGAVAMFELARRRSGSATL